MKKLSLTFIIILAVSQFVHAQWLTDGSLTHIVNTVSIGTTATPPCPFYLYNTTARSTNNGSYSDFGFDSFNNSAWQGSRLYFGKTRGTQAAPLAVQFDDFLGWLDFYGSDGTAMQRAAQIVVRADGTPSSGKVPGVITFNTAGPDGVNTERMRVNSAGNIGIGTADTKGYKLGVNGGIIATAVTVKLYADWADYVFNKDYRLPSLTDVKTYIDKNHHLPEIPSAQQIEKDGINLGEMNKLLVKKVEELTLYLIESNKKQTEQEERMQKMQQQLELLSSKIK